MEELKKMCEKLEGCAMMELAKDKSEVDTHELGEVFDMIKDIKEAMYYGKIVDAMDNPENVYGEDYDQDGPKFYRGRSKTTGRFVHRGYEVPDMMERRMEMRDMDRSENKMYYSPNALTQSRHYEEGRSYEDGHRMGYEEGHRNGYEEGHRMGYEEGHRTGYNKGMNESRSYRQAGQSRYDSARKGFEEGQDKEQKSKALTEYLRTIADDITNMVMEMDPQERQIVKNKLQAIQNKIA